MGVTDMDRVYGLMIDRCTPTNVLSECERTFRRAFHHGNDNVAVASIGVAAAALCITPALAVTDLPDGFFRDLVTHRLVYEQTALTTHEAARVLGCTTRHVRRLARTGRINGRVGPAGAWSCAGPSVISYRERKS